LVINSNILNLSFTINLIRIVYGANIKEGCGEARQNKQDSQNAEIKTTEKEISAKDAEEIEK
jgi:hypothetical protein